MKRIDPEKLAAFFKQGDYKPNFDDVIYDPQTRDICITGLIILSDNMPIRQQRADEPSNEYIRTAGYREVSDVVGIAYHLGLVTGWLGKDLEAFNIEFRPIATAIGAPRSKAALDHSNAQAELIQGIEDGMKTRLLCTATPL